MMIQSLKEQARKHAFARRKQAFEEQDYEIVDTLLSQTQNAQVIAAYMAMRTEMDPIAAMEAWVRAGKTVVVPIIEGAGRPLRFHEWTPDCEMEEGAFGAFIPKNTCALAPDFVLAPLVAFDDSGTRLGYGGGFYDRTLADLRASSPTPYIGLAFDAQRADTPLPREATDIPLDGVITERGFQRFNP